MVKWTGEKLGAIPPIEFENWALIALGGIPNNVQVGDVGVDGHIFPVSFSAAPRKQQEGELGLKERWYPIQVKQKDKAGRPDIVAFEARGWKSVWNGANDNQAPPLPEKNRGRIR